jgi:L-lactate dehydrogenase complex protein LldG
MSRESMLAKIRESLQTGSTGPDVVPPGHLAAYPVASAADRAAQFAESLRALGGQVFEAQDPNEAAAMIQNLVQGRSTVASGSPVVAACGYPASFSRGAAASADFGITSADYALADTGSLIFLSESAESRLISLLPPHHIAVIPQDRILAGLDQLFERVPRPAENSSSMVIVTGPSRTGDIEMRLVRGVHGPGEVTVIIIQDVTHR